MTSATDEDRRPRVTLFGVDAFTDRPFGGNAAMVCLLPEPADDEASPRRGRLAVAVEDDRVHVGGHAITITRGEWVF